MDYITLQKDKISEIIIIALNKIGFGSHHGHMTKQITDALISANVASPFLDRLIKTAKMLAQTRIPETVMFATMDEFRQYREWENEQGVFISPIGRHSKYDTYDGYVAEMRIYGIKIYLFLHKDEHLTDRDYERMVFDLTGKRPEN